MSSIFDENKMNAVIAEFGFLFMVDTTQSMGHSVEMLQEVFRTCHALTELATGNPAAIMTFSDYDRRDSKVVEMLQGTASPSDISTFLGTMRPSGGGGVPEAHKTALRTLLDHLAGSKSKTCVVMFTDAPPHGTHATAQGVISSASLDMEGKLEHAVFEKKQWNFDWKAICHDVKAAGVTVVIVLTSPTPSLVAIWTELGFVVQVRNNSVVSLTNVSMAIMHGMLGLHHGHPIEYTYRSDDGQTNTSARIAQVYSVDINSRLPLLTPEGTFGVFQRLLTPEQPRNALVLATNPLLGQVWRRLICGTFRYKSDGMYASECQQVMDLLSKCILLLTGPDRTTIQDWIAASHDETHWIREQTQQAMPTATTALILPAELKGTLLKGTLSLNDILAIAHGGGNILALSAMIRALEVVPIPSLADDDSAPTFLPLGSEMKVAMLFALMGNLLSSGLRFGKMMSLIVAIMSLPNRYLSADAHRFLTENLGGWISWDLKEDGTQKFPVCWSVSFMRILKMCPDQYLTTKEVAFRDNFLRIVSLIGNHRVELEITLPRHGSALWHAPAWKRRCDGCGHPRCFTTFPGDSPVCGVCMALQDPQLVAESKSRGHLTDPTKMSEELASFAQCSKIDCKAVYSVTNTKDLNVRPICHECRHRYCSIDRVTCGKCLNVYLSPGESACRAMTDAIDRYTEQQEHDKAQILTAARHAGLFVCPGCVDRPKDMVREVSVTIQQLIDENPWLERFVPVTDYKRMMDHRVKLWERVRTLEQLALEQLTLEQLALEQLTHLSVDMKMPEVLRYNGLFVHNPNEVVRAMVDALLNNNGMECCQLCADDVRVSDLVPACGHCPNRICRKCSHRCYSGVVVGEVVAHGQTVCPFCKTPPKHRLVGDNGMILGHLRNVRPNRRRPMCPWDYRTIYACCHKCLRAMPALDRACAQAAPEIHGFTCGDCREADRDAKTGSLLANAITAPDGKECPGCGATTHHTGGCNHITCTNPLKDVDGKVFGECSTHWCWHCGVGGDDTGPFDNTNIYDHMARCGGIFPRDVVLDDADDDNVLDDE